MRDTFMLKPISITLALFLTLPAAAQDLSGDFVSDIFGNITRASNLAGEMSVTMSSDSEDEAVTEVLRFEPWQMLDELYRDDIVLLMRHGPTDWSMRDASDVAPTDCENQRVMTETGQLQMRDLGTLMVVNDLIPGRIVVSEWCRNEQTFEALKRGMLRADDASLLSTTFDTSPDLNLLLALQGAPNVSNLRQLISDWDGSDGNGPLLIISHYTNIQELTQFNVYEGEMLVIDPKRDNRVLGYLRLKSAAPDIGHFDAAVVEASAGASAD